MKVNTRLTWKSSTLKYLYCCKLCECFPRIFQDINANCYCKIYIFVENSLEAYSLDRHPSNIACRWISQRSLMIVFYTAFQNLNPYPRLLWPLSPLYYLLFDVCKHQFIKEGGDKSQRVKGVIYTPASGPKNC